MFAALDVNWAGTLLGCVGVVLIPIPAIFYIYGAKIREKSAFAPTGPFGMEQPLVDEEEELDAAAAEKVPTRHSAAGDQV
jgi:MFS transporter, DHA1 family, multidrug resistance protein